MKIVSLLTLCMLVLLVLLAGCAYNASYTTEKTDPTTKQVVRLTKARGFTFFDSSAQLAQFQNQVGGTNGSGTTIGSLSTEASSTNLNSIIASAVGAAVSAAKKP
jgi:hypothetical protein